MYACMHVCTYLTTHKRILRYRIMDGLFHVVKYFSMAISSTIVPSSLIHLFGRAYKLSNSVTLPISDITSVYATIIPSVCTLSNHHPYHLYSAIAQIT